MRYRGLIDSNTEWTIEPGLLTIVRGPPGSGKTTWASHEAAITGAIVIEGDHWRHPIGGLYLWTADEDLLISQWIALEARKWLRQGRNVLAVDVFDKISLIRKVEKIAGRAERIVRLDGRFRNHHEVSEQEVAAVIVGFESLGREIFVAAKSNG